MFTRRTATIALGIALTATACASTDGDSGSAIPVPGQNASAPLGSPSEDGEADTTPTTPPTTSDATTDDDAPEPEPADDFELPANVWPAEVDEPTDDEPRDETAEPDEADEATTTTTTTTVPELDVFDPVCVVEVQPGDSLGAISESFDDPTVYPATIVAENELDGETIFPGQLLDVCVDNGLDDITGAERAPNEAILSAAREKTVKGQQEKLNELFDGLGMRELLVDGISGPVTQQRLCAARVALGLPVTRADMEAGSDEEALLMATDALRQPFTTALLSERWILIDRTCQVMFTGEGDNGIVNIFSTSTGEEGFETRDQNRSSAYRFDPALDNGGWHNSTTYPVPEDNPLNGNMYKPLYFDGGQAIHGSNNVPTTPQSKGCARLRVADQDALIAWLGLQDLGGPTYNNGRINVTVNVQGAYRIPGGDLFQGDAVDA